MAFSRNQSDEIYAMMDACRHQLHPPVHTRRKLNLAWRKDRNSVILFEILSIRGEPPRIDNYDFAKATWVEKEKEWHIYWKSASGKWQRYKPLESVVNLLRFMIEVEKDPYGCFWGHWLKATLIEF
jgi:Protein of unknown function (DUF3024)